MANISLSVNDSAARALLSRAPNVIAIAWRGTLEDSRTYVTAIQKRYPPQRPGSSYIRTKTLDRSWSSRLVGSGLQMSAEIGSNGNIAPYNRRVQDATQQARVHRGRWNNTIQNTAQRVAPRIQRFFDDRLRAAGL